jgi:hypothetical protein
MVRYSGAHARSSSINEAPDDGAERAQPENHGGGLNYKTPAAFFGGFA